MSPRSQQNIVYGKFLWPARPFTKGSKPGSSEPDIALEILREFKASEFVGRLYTKPYLGAAWAPAQLDRIKETAWYKAYEQFRQDFLFIMQGSGPWELLDFRAESNESGPYVAVALREIGKAPPWVGPLQKRLRI